MADAAARIDELRALVEEHDHRYHVLDAPSISDEAYDALFRELRALEERHPELARDDSPTQRVGGAPLASLETAEHVAPMLSLDSSASEAGFRAFDARVRKALGGDEEPAYWVEPKLDGLSLELVYEGGALVRAVTRGDGQRGEVVTANVRTIRSVPLRLRAAGSRLPELVSVRCEVFLPLEGFDDVNEALLAEGKAPFANPRNAAAGTVRQLDPALAAARPLALYAYDVLQGDGGRGSLGVDRHGEVLEALASWGLPVNPENVLVRGGDEVWRVYAAVGERRDHLPYEIDGVVVKLDDLADRRSLGTTAHHPRWAYAVKFPPREEVSQVLRIVVSVGRTGAVTPVALLRPVSIGGVTVSRANLHNREDIERKDIREGDTVRVERAGDVIPQVVGRVGAEGEARAAPFRMPERCPSCETPLVEVGPYTLCPNALACPAQLVGRLVHFGSRRGLDIEGLGERTAAQLVERGIVRHLADLFDVPAERFAELEGFAERSAEKLVATIGRARATTLPRLLYALSVPEVGAAVARTLAEAFGTLDALRAATVEALEAVPGIGPVMAQGIHRFFADPATAAELDALAERVDIAPLARQEASGGPLEGVTVVFTGALERFTRGQAQALVQEHGGAATGSVSRSTTLVVAGADAGSKLERARTLGIAVVDEEGFLRFLEEHGVDAAVLGAATSATADSGPSEPATAESATAESVTAESATAESVTAESAAGA